MAGAMDSGHIRDGKKTLAIKSSSEGVNAMKRWLAILIVFGLAGCLLSRAAEAANSYSFDLTWGTSGSGNGQFSYPYGVAVDASGNVYVADRGNNRIEKFDTNGNYLAQWGTSGSGSGQFNQPFGVAVDSSGNVYVADTDNNRIEKFVPYGTINATVLYNGQPLQNAYLYLQGSIPYAPRDFYRQPAAFIAVNNPSDANGILSAEVPAGTWYVRITKRAGNSSVYGPPRFI